MNRIYLLIILLVVIIFGIYMLLSYGWIFNEIGEKDLKSSDKNQIYMIGNNSNNKGLVYVALGDSLAAGVGVDDYKQSYPYLIAEKLSVKNNIILKDEAMPGYKTSDVKNSLLSKAISDKPDVVTLLIGVNDVMSSISKEDFENNYDQILKSLTQETNAKIYIINIPSIGSDKLVLPPYNGYFDFQTKGFNKIIEDLAKKYNLSYIDIYSATLAEFKKSDSYYSIDLFHPSAKGYAFWADIIYANFN